jgi:hypothetical protein
MCLHPLYVVNVCLKQKRGNSGKNNKTRGEQINLSPAPPQPLQLGMTAITKRAFRTMFALA